MISHDADETLKNYFLIGRQSFEVEPMSILKLGSSSHLDPYHAYCESCINLSAFIGGNFQYENEYANYTNRIYPVVCQMSGMKALKDELSCKRYRFE